MLYGSETSTQVTRWFDVGRRHTITFSVIGQMEALSLHSVQTKMNEVPSDVGSISLSLVPLRIKHLAKPSRVK
jgi:hypothetical protein